MRLYPLYYFTILWVALLTVFLNEGRAQKFSYLNFSSVSTQQIGRSWISQPFSTLLRSDCLSLTMGLGLHFAEKKNGIFLFGCIEKDSIPEINFLFYPNPVHSIATLILLANGVVDHNVQLQIVDPLGRTVKIQSLARQDLQKGYSMNLSELSSGVYFIRINSSAFNRVIKFIKN